MGKENQNTQIVTTEKNNNRKLFIRLFAPNSMKKIILASFILIAFMLQFVSAHEKQVSIQINEDGTSTENIFWKIEVDSLLSYIPQSEWKISIPKRVQDLTILENGKEIEYEIRNLPDKSYDELVFKNEKNIYYFSDHSFSIKYTEKNNPLVFEPEYLYRKTFTRSEIDDEFYFQISLPENAVINSISPEAQKQESNKIVYHFDKGETKEIEIKFEISDSKTEYITLFSKHYELTLPKRYSQEFISILEEADSGVDFVEKKYGFESPHKWKIEISEDFEKSEQIGGSYLGDGRIFLQYNILQKSREKILESILHETVHGFNSKFFKEETPNFWFEEGTAVYTSLEALDELGYSTESERKEKVSLIENCKDFREISPQWSPNSLLLSPPEEIEIQCKDIITNEIALGYAQSYFVIQGLEKKYGEDTLQKFFSVLDEKEISFSSDKEILTSQVNEILSEAVGEDTTSTLESLGVETKKKEQLLDFQS